MQLPGMTEGQDTVFHSFNYDMIPEHMYMSLQTPSSRLEDAILATVCSAVFSVDVTLQELDV